MPPLRMLKFNRFMDHDDGMLANVIMRSEALSYDEANQAIRLSVSDFLAKVQREGRGAEAPRMRGADGRRGLGAVAFCVR